MVVHYLVTHDVGHRRHFRETGEFVDGVDVVQQLVAQRQLLAGDVVLGPDSKLKVWVEFPVHFYDLALAFGHFALNPHQMDHFGDDIGSVALGVREPGLGRIEDSEFVQRLPVLEQVVQVVGHRIDVMLEVVLGYLRSIHFFPLPAAYYYILDYLYRLRHVEEVGVGLYQPFCALGVGYLRPVVLLGQV